MPTKIWNTLSRSQKHLARKHGTPPEFARAVYEAVPSFISMAEADQAIKKFNREWDLAGKGK